MRYGQLLTIVDQHPPAPCTHAPDLWFADTPDRHTTHQAKRICATQCPTTLADACLTYALHNTEHGVWGGLTEPERARWRQQHGIIVPRWRTHTHPWDQK
jgi:hypothetical protein